MSAEVQKHGLTELLAFSNADFDKEIKEMSLKDLLDTISKLQKEMTKEQENFNSLSAELSSLNKNSRQYKQISKEMTASQNRLTALMDRSMKCFQQQGNQSTSTKFPNVQRRNSLKETNSTEHTSNKPVQRNQSARIPSKTEGDITPAVKVNKANTKSTPALVSSANKPVYLKPLTDVHSTKIEVKKPSSVPNGTSSIVKPTQTFQNGPHQGSHLVNGDGKKSQPVRTTASFNLQKSRSNEFLANGPLKNGNVNIKSGGSDNNAESKPQFNVILRKTNRNLIDNEEQESNFRHSVDLDLRESHKPSMSKPIQKSAENLMNRHTVSSVQITSTQKPKENGTVQKVPDINKKDNVVQNSKINENKPKIQNEIQKTSSVKKENDMPKKVVNSSITIRPTTAVEARALSGGDRMNLLEEIQNFKRKPSPDNEKESVEVKVQGQNDQHEIVKSSIKPSVK